MADFEAPSFSLGLDFLFDPEPQFPVRSTSPKPRNDDAEEDDEEEELGSQVADSDPDSGPEPTRVLRRLRRGLSRPRETTPLNGRDVDDDIEDFSSQEDVVEELHPTAQFHSMCSSSKISLNGCGAIAKSLSELKAKKNEQASTVTASASTAETSHGEKLFTKLKVSPVRLFQLIDSDSDDPSTSEEQLITGHNKASQSSAKQQSNASDLKSTGEQKRKGSECKAQSEDLWKDFTPINSFRIPTPALDEVCEEYFRSVKDKNASQKPGNDTFAKSCSDFRKTTNDKRMEQPWNEAKPFVPAHRYYLHHDPRVRKLLRDRFPNFFPLGVDDSRNQHNGVSVVDYMGQFGNKDPSKRQTTQQVGVSRNTKATQSSVAKKNSRKCSNSSPGEASHASQSWVDPKQCKATPTSRARKISKKRQSTPSTSSAREGLHDSGSWVDPRSSAGVDFDSGKRGSLSNSQSGGQWFTGPNGRKVYINKNGQELTGQMAYRQYKRDRGGYSKSKRKTSSKKKT